MSLPEQTLVDLLRQRATQTPEGHAYTFLVDGDKEGERLTYGQLDQTARAVAVQLQDLIQPEERVLLLYPAGLDIIKAFFGALYAGAIAVPAPFPEASRLKRTLPRLEAIVQDADATVVLATANIIAQLEEYRESFTALKTLKCLEIQDIDPALAERWQAPEIKPQSLAYLQYTSGSTSTPKGVMLSHENVVRHCGAIQRVCEYDRDSRSVTWLPYFHDYGLVEGILVPLYNGTPCYVMSPFAFMKRPLNWLRAISRHQLTHTQAPNFAYDQCVKRVKPEQVKDLDLSSWRSAGNGAEPINPKVLREFYALYGPQGFRWFSTCPAYGLAEATLMISCCSPSLEPTLTAFEAPALVNNQVIPAQTGSALAREMVSCGPLLPETQVLIVDPLTNRVCAENEVGEIWAAAPGVALGYWQRAEATQETFQSYTEDGRGPFLRTGDLGFLWQGNLYISSRIKDLIIIGGTNHYPQDIEWNLERSHPAFRPHCSAAFSIVHRGEERLVVALELERGAVAGDLEEIFGTIRRVITQEHELGVYGILLLSRGSLPKTASGKIQRSACWRLFQSGQLDVIAQWLADGAEIQGLTAPAQPLTPNPLSPIQPFYPLETTAPEVSRQRTDQLIAWLRDYSEERIDSRTIDERRCLPPYIVLDLGNQGVMGLQIPEKFGGLGLRNTDFMRVWEQLGAIDISIASLLFIHNANGVRPLVGYATPETQAELLPRIAQGRELASFALTEPVAGSNLPNLGTVCYRNDQGWRIRGAKRWNASGWAGIVHVFARLVDEKGKPGHPTAFTVRQGTPGLKVGPESLTMGVRGIFQNIIYFDDVQAGSEQLLGAEGKGMDVAEEAMLVAHLCMGAVSAGGMKRCAQLMGRYAERRQVSTGKLLDSPLTLGVLSELLIKTTLVETLTYSLAEILDLGGYPPKELGMILKIFATDALWQAADNLVELLGGRGYMENNIAPQILRDARMLRIGEGANEIMTVTVGRRIGPSEELQQFLTQYFKQGEMAERLKAAVQEIQGRALTLEARFTSRSAALSWGYNLIGQTAVWGVVLAVAEHRLAQSPTGELKLACQWAGFQFERTLQQALQGHPQEGFFLKPQQVQSQIRDYVDAIGDLEQRPPGSEDKLDPYLKKDPNGGGFSDYSHLPGNINPETIAPKEVETAPAPENLSLEAKKQLLQKLLAQKAAANQPE